MDAKELIKLAVEGAPFEGEDEHTVYDKNGGVVHGMQADDDDDGYHYDTMLGVPAMATAVALADALNTIAAQAARIEALEAAAREVVYSRDELLNLTGSVNGTRFNAALAKLTAAVEGK
jgi:hypothetical protein